MMSKKCSCSILLVPIMLLLQAILLASDLLLLAAGSGSIDNSDHLPRLSGYYIVLIEADEYSTTVSGEIAPYKGLPDSHDFSIAKDWFAIYASLYCSGRKNGPDQYAADYCSPWPGKQLFDLQWLWRVWGADLVADNLIGVLPQTIFASLMTSIAASALTIVLGLLSFCSHWCLMLATVVALISLISSLTLAASSQAFATRLTSAHIPISSPGTGNLVVTAGVHHLLNAWIGAGVSLIAALMLVFIMVRARRRRRGAAPLKARGRRGGGGTGYRNLDAFGRDVDDGTEQIRLVSRSVSPGMSRFEGKQPASGGNTAYEPMRHRDVR